MDKESKQQLENEDELISLDAISEIESDKDLFLSDIEEDDEAQDDNRYEEQTDEEKSEDEYEQQEEDKEDPEPDEVLTKEEIKLIKNIYEQLKDKKKALKDKTAGAFPADLLGAVLHIVGMTPTLAQLQTYLGKFDESGSGWLTADDLCKAAALQRTAAEPITMEQVEEAFKYLIGKYPNTRKLIMELLTIGEPLTFTEANIMRKATDPKVKGFFEFEKLLNMLYPERRKRKKGGKKKGKGKKK